MDLKTVKTKQGVPIYYLELPNVKSAAVGVLVRAGTCQEKWPEEAGLAHALEHMLFQGTEDFPESRQLSAYIEDVGGYLNAWTWKEMTFYYNVLPAGKVERGPRLLSQMLRKPLLKEENVKVEMKNVVREIKQKYDDNQNYLMTMMEKIVYGGHPLGRASLGTEKTAKKFKPADFKKFMKKHYRPENFVFLAAGNFKISEIKELFEKYFPERAAEGKTALKLAELSCPPAAKERVIYQETKLCHIGIGALICGVNDEYQWPLKMFQAMIGQGMSSPLFQEVRDKRGLAYSVSAQCEFWSAAGDFFIYIGTDPARKDEAIKVSLDVIYQSKNSEELLSRAKDKLLGRLALIYDNPMNILEAAAAQLGKRGKIFSFEELERKIKNVDISQVNAAVEKYLAKDKLNVLSITPKRK